MFFNVYSNELIFCTHIVFLLFTVYAASIVSKEALICFVVFQPIFANLFLSKHVNLFDMHVSTTDPYIVSALIGLNLICSCYGYKEAVRVVYCTALTMLFFIVISNFQLIYYSINQEPFISYNLAYNLIFSATNKFVFMSLLILILVEFLNIFIFFLFKSVNIVNISVISFFSLIITQFIDSFLFSFVVLRGYYPNLNDVFIMSMIVKTFTIIVSVGISTFFNFSCKKFKS